MKTIKVKTTIKAGNIELSLTEDYTSYAKALIECNNIFTSTGIKMTEENILDFFKEGSFTYEQVDTLNGDHYLFGWLERICQDSKYFELLAAIDDEDEETLFIVSLVN